ncbi:hypothetical protein BCV69DRAFT_275983 [Microstroma glucosiphilum]|uniref:RlpA-like protein double-psi beta-barrel domain-containing protein n=1 Tax=Pseudomicrostroma glucosiphilum TaxID=1684307 RepID=A0A316UDF4_9BASI|nr:hypothetical protein BCV69DRAFT_275983 [Pseudomicrostroma glucosiphilum]PWN23236.1 hypothetical protein BCV69DRAFT_275983 [Pseudomicrostroma glucosiphilum]
MQFTTAFVAAVAALSTMALAAPIESRADAHSGVATYFYQNGNPGSCGNYNSDDAWIVAVSQEHHDSSNCGKTITIEYNGVQKVATIADTCPGCGFYDLDLSSGLFGSFADHSLGELNIKWWANW